MEEKAVFKLHEQKPVPTAFLTFSVYNRSSVHLSTTILWTCPFSEFLRTLLQVAYSIFEAWTSSHALGKSSSIFDDVTACGNTLIYLPMRPNEKGPRIAIYGDIYYCEAGQDHATDEVLRTDSLTGIEAFFVDESQAGIVS